MGSLPVRRNCAEIRVNMLAGMEEHVSSADQSLCSDYSDDKIVMGGYTQRSCSTIVPGSECLILVVRVMEEGRVEYMRTALEAVV